MFGNTCIRWILALTHVAALVPCTSVEEYSCPLQSSATSLSITSNPNCNSTGSVYRGIRHTYLKIGSQCYDWGYWSTVRSMSCTDARLACCVSTGRLEETIDSHCADGISKINNMWVGQRGKYSLLHNTCQDYTRAVKKILTSCADPQTYFG